MRKSMILLGAAASLVGCGQSGGNATVENSSNATATEASRPAYCFFKDSETKDWKAKTDRSGNVVVSGKAYREDSRYKALLSPATISGTTAEIAPTITQNDTGFGAPDNWWPLSQTIPNSQAITTVTVKCGTETLATLSVPREK
jgi:hypothetical protein